MNTLEYLRIAQQDVEVPEGVYAPRVQIITNFTDDLLKKLFIGLCRANQVYPSVVTMPYKQYHRVLKGLESTFEHTADITYIWFDVSAYVHNEFAAGQNHFSEVLGDLAELVKTMEGKVIVNTFGTPSASSYGNLHTEYHLVRAVEESNQRLRELSHIYKNMYVVDLDRLVRQVGERQARDLRNLYAYDIPYTTDFIFELVREWFAYLEAIRGRTKKCLVLDLDNTLWGGVVGEAGPMGIALGPGYPGYAFQNFQHAVLRLHERGVILAINSRNNPEDVDEVFDTNPNMVLKKEHFASVRTNWDTKVDNLVSIAEELNIGLDSMVFLDDDPVNRDHVRTILPVVSVPELSVLPEEYIQMLFDLRDFHQLSLTEEDRAKGRMYAQERSRTEVKKSSASLDEYITGLDIAISVSENDKALIPRVAQLSLKTNQFNLTTVRHTEDVLHSIVSRGGLIFAGTVSDKFGSYGTVIEAIVTRPKKTEAHVESFLMSCRTMGRHIEHTFFDHVVRVLANRGVTEVRAWYGATPKNTPCASFLAEMGCRQVNTSFREGFEEYVLDSKAYLASNIAEKISSNGINIV